MREIKFRGKQVSDGTWVYGYFAKTTLTDEPMCVGDCRICNLIIKDGTYFHVDPATVGQFTCLYDKNGKEIYEGDILKRTIRPLNALCYDETYVVKTIDYYIYCGETYALFRPQLWSSECVVIGNIHDNPEFA